MHKGNLEFLRNSIKKLDNQEESYTLHVSGLNEDGEMQTFEVEQNDTLSKETIDFIAAMEKAAKENE